MKANRSPLILNNFLLLNFHFQTINPQNNKDTKKLVDYLNEYALDIDFAFKNTTKDSFQLFTIIKVNDIDKPLPGYVLRIEGVCFFTLDNSVELTEEEKSNLLQYSGLNICINNLRNILATTTANGPFNKYTLPSIDVNQLLLDKFNHINEQNQKKNKKK